MTADAVNLLLATADARTLRDLPPLLPELSCGPATLASAATVDEALALASQPHHAILLDLDLAADVLDRVRSRAPSAAIIVLLHENDEPQALHALRHGAQDYLVKGHIRPARLANAICYAVERRRTDLALADERHLLRTVIENLPDPVYVKDAQGRYLLDNPAHAKFLRIGSRAELSGKTVFDFFPADLASRYHADDLQSLSTGLPILNREEPIVDTQGQQRWLWTAKVPFRDSAGRVAGLVGISRDITDRMLSDQQLRRAMEDVKASHEELIQAQLQLIQAEKMDSVGRLAAGVAHEVKNPLAVLLMGLDYLAKGSPDASLAPNTAAVIRAMRDAVRRADAIIRGLVDFSAPRQLELKDADLNEVVRQSLLLVKHELTAAHVTACVDLAAELPRVRLDENKIQQVLINLLINAVHAMSGGGRIEIRSYAADYSPNGNQPTAVVEVDDSGHGIPEDKLIKIWDPFYTTKPPGKGTGLGLTVAKKIVELHGGTIDLRNRPDARGARVTLTFKAEAPAPAAPAPALRTAPAG